MNTTSTTSYGEVRWLKQLPLDVSSTTWIAISWQIFQFSKRFFTQKKQEEGAPVVRIELEDYLVGLCNLVSELSRMSVNRVTIGDFEFAVQAAKFCSEILAGFRLLNFRNDYLRRRFDGMKYDVKKLEEVVYDISIRGLLK
jgi:predicted translin family RNA/ssDNA-binding protein